MKSNKSKKMFIIIISVVVALIIIAGIAYAVLSPKLFKTDKDYFFEYMSQLFDNENGFIDNKLNQYNSKKKSSVYQNEGNITFKVETENLDTDTIKSLNNYNIEFAGRTDNVENKAEETIKVNYSNDISFPIEYKKAYGKVGLKFTELSKRYFGVKEEQLMNLFGTNAIVETEVDPGYGDEDEEVVASKTSQYNPLDFENYKLTAEEKNRLKDMYLAEISNILNNADFTKVSSSESDGYTLELSDEKAKTVIVKVLEILKNDEIMLDKLGKISGTDIAPSQIEKIKKEIEAKENGEGTTNITVYGTNGKLNKIQIQIKDDLKITITKQSSDDELEYEVEIEKQDSSVSINVSFSGLQNLEEITEKYIVSINTLDNGTYTYKFTNTNNFLNNEIQIDDYEKNEFIDLNSLSADKKSQIIMALMKEIEKANSEKLEEAEIVGGNPIINLIPGSSLSMYQSFFDITSNSQDDKNEKEEDDKESKNTEDQDTNTTTESEDKEDTNTTNTSNTVVNTINTTTQRTDSTANMSSQNTTTNTTGTNTTSSENASSSNTSLINSMEKLSKESFNQKLSQYEGENVKGVTVKSLLMQVIATNMADEDHQVLVTGDIALTGDTIPENLETSKFYKVKCTGYGSDGYINKIEVKLKK